MDGWKERHTDEWTDGSIGGRCHNTFYSSLKTERTTARQLTTDLYASGFKNRIKANIRLVLVLTIV